MENEDKVTEFSEKFMVKKEYVQSYLPHSLTFTLQGGSDRTKGAQSRPEERRKREKNITGWNLSSRVNLTKLKVLELDKYLKKTALTKGTKAEKINAITSDVLRKNKPNVIETASNRVEQSAETESEEEDSDEDLGFWRK